jgi:hypothetical protein
MASYFKIIPCVFLLKLSSLVIIPCLVTGRYQNFGGITYLHHEGRRHPKTMLFSSLLSLRPDVSVSTVATLLNRKEIMRPVTPI